METGTQQTQIKQFERKPNFEFHSKLSKDGRFWIMERVETWIIPANYLSTIATNHAREKEHGTNESAPVKARRRGKGNADSNG